jgi:hypothetical protein
LYILSRKAVPTPTVVIPIGLSYEVKPLPVLLSNNP